MGSKGVPMATAITHVLSWLKGEQVGVDSEGNKYYQERREPAGRRQRRWGIYEGADEASRIPPEWHAWLHYTVKQMPDSNNKGIKPWQQEHRPNLTGTEAAYRPPGHTLEGGRRSTATGDYDPWIPN